MAKITINSLTTNYASTTLLNSIFSSLASELNNKVLYRDSPTGEPNSMQNDLDMNSNDVLNVNAIDVASLSINGVFVAPSDVAVTTLPPQAGNSGRFLISNGTVASWSRHDGQTWDTLAELASAIDATDIGKVFSTKEHTSSYGYEGGNSYIVKSGTITDDNGSLIQGTTDTSVYLEALFPNGISTKKFGASPSATAAANVTAMQNCIDYCHSVFAPCLFDKGDYNINAALTIYYFMKIIGAGESTGSNEFNYNAVYTRINQTAAAPVFTTSSGTIAEDAVGHIYISDMTLQGGNSSSQIGTYGIYDTSSPTFTAERVRCEWFVNDGIHCVGSLQVKLNDCTCRYNQGYGLRLEYGTFGPSDNTNANASRVIGGQYGQNQLGGIYIDNSMLKVLISTRFESNGQFFSGSGFGIYLSLDAKAVTIRDSYFEDNEEHIIVGDEAFSSTTTIPAQTTIEDNFLFGINGTDYIRINSGRDCSIRKNYFGETNVCNIRVNRLADNPVIKENVGHVQVIDDADNIVSFDHVTSTNDLSQTDLTQSEWTLSNATIAKVAVAPPVPGKQVYRVTESTAALTELSYTDARASFDLDEHKTIGCWIKSTDDDTLQLYWGVFTDNPITAWAGSNDTFTATKEWKWFSFGRNIPAASLDDIVIRITAPNGGTYDICDFRVMPGLVYEPFYPDRIYGSQTITIATGVATMTHYTPLVYIDTESAGATDDLDTLTFADVKDGDVVTIRAANDGRTVVAKDGTGNLALNADFSLDSSQDTITLIRAGSEWLQVSSSNNGA